MGYKENRRRNSINPRDIVGGAVSGGTASASAFGGFGSGGRTLLAHYTNTGNQSITLSAKAYTYTLLNMATAVANSTLVTGTAPFTLTTDDDYTLWVEAECTFTPSANSDRYVLAIVNGTATNKGDGAYTFRSVVRGTSRQAFVQGVIDMFLADVLQIELRVFNSSNAAETLTVTAAKVWVYVV